MSSKGIEVRLPDGSVRTFPRGVTAGKIAEDLSPGLARRAVAALVDGESFDLSRAIDRDAEVRILTPADDEALEIFRHSSAHLLAAAVMQLFPEAKYGVGPPIEGGFFYDFARDEPFTPEDLDKIEAKMKELASRKVPFEREEIPKREAVARFQSMGQPFKMELVEEKGDDVVSCYRLGEFYDFCEGPHVPDTGIIKAIKVLGSSAAYWKGDEAKAPMQRIYATTFFDEKSLAEHLARLEEAKKRDHRKLGRELELFLIRPEAPGQAFWLPRGLRVVNGLVDYMRGKLDRRGYLEIKTPLIMNTSVWERSGHLEHYQENMYFVDSEEARFAIKPMNCPGAAMVYESSLRSYRDLPLRLSEFGHCHRNERSGVLSGLTRVRSFVQDDAHIYCAPEQLENEVVDLIDLVREVYSELGFEGFRVELSTRPEGSIGTDEQWEQAEEALTHALERSGGAHKLNPGDGAFYGPKIDFHVEDAIGRRHQCATIQVDFTQAERFDLYYAAEDGRRKRPVVVHRAILGSLERFMAVLIEHTGGAFPSWLAPIQAVVLPISEKHHDYAGEVLQTLRSAGFRAEVDARNEKVGYKIREAQLKKIPFMLVAGDKEKETGTVAVRNRKDGDEGPVQLADFVTRLESLVSDKALLP
ncbi:MAG TPA: threonine--tRNA ligase [Vicinamibacteria bacterium]|nr:threonine--tRNA ligase [Vicinamibacteria bacterium]